MKKCAYCGQENVESAARCSGCGTEFAAPPAATEAPAPWVRVAVLKHEVEAERMALELNQRTIPHVLVSYGDSAFDGLFQGAQGWGHVEAPREHTEAVLRLLEDIRGGSPSEGHTA